MQAANDVIKIIVIAEIRNSGLQNDDGEQIVYYRADDEQDEAVLSPQLLLILFVKWGKNFMISQFFYRTNAQSRTIEEALLKSNIPYTMVGGTKFYSRKEIRDIIAYLNVITHCRQYLL